MKFGTQPKDNSPPAPRDLFWPPQDIEDACAAFIDGCRAFMPAQPTSAPPSLVDGAEILDRRQSMEILTAAAAWKEYYKTQIGWRQAGVRAHVGWLAWTRNHIKFVHKGDMAGLTEDQFAAIQKHEYAMNSLSAEVTVLESLLAQQDAVYKAASRNLSGNIAQ